MSEATIKLNEFALKLSISLLPASVPKDDMTASCHLVPHVHETWRTGGIPNDATCDYLIISIPGSTNYVTVLCKVVMNIFFDFSTIINV